MMEPRQSIDWDDEAQTVPIGHAKLGAYSIRYDSRLVEEAVSRTVKGYSPAERHQFHHQREAIYEEGDPDARESRFQQLHAEWFVRVGLQAPLESLLSERAALIDATQDCLVVPARIRSDETADLYDCRLRQPDDVRDAGDAISQGSARRLVVRIRSETLADPKALTALLQHELMHVTDMIDVTFGYEPELPASDAGPSYDNILRDRYRAVWDSCIDGRLFGRRLVSVEARTRRLGEFARAFPMLGARTEESFGRWFDEAQPTHAAIVAFVQEPRGPGESQGPVVDGRCPICRFPSPTLDPDPGRLSPGALAELRLTHPTWTLHHGLCVQCADLYEARSLDTASVNP
jgi:hypothetical protein